MALPPELLEKLQELHDKITDIEDAVDPLLEVPYEEHCQFSLACDHSSNAVSKKVVAFYDQLLRDYSQATEKSAVFDILGGPFRKYPFFLPDVLPKLVSMARDDKLTLGKKTELLNLADAFIRRDVLPKLGSPEQLAASLGGICEDLWAKLDSEKLKQPYVASVLRLLQRITSLAAPELVTSLAKHLPSVRGDYQAILEALKPFSKAIQRELHGKLDGTFRRLAEASA
ncbi:hypothetical protein AAVH_01581 [Aphelenchoides avenae]|nr:hypothetical protein AAVH_01581 [Aphelenchus avenae]